MVKKDNIYYNKDNTYHNIEYKRVNSSIEELILENIRYMPR